MLFACGLLLVPAGGMAQGKPFSADPDAFLQEVNEMMVGADKKEGRAFMENTFTPMWTGAFLDRSRKARVIEVANFMQKKRFDAFPHFRDYFGAVAAFPAGGRSTAEFDAWLQAMDQLVQKGRKQNVAAFINMCRDLFQENVIYRSASTTWRSTSAKFTFGFDSVAYVAFPKADLICLSRGDSSVIQGTTGVYYPGTERWHGRGGMVTWERAGLRPTATFAQWDHAYVLPLKTAGLEVDSVVFNDPYFERGMLGRLTDKLMANVTPKNASYPRFESYDRRLRIKDIAEGVDFEGGFTMQGAKLRGYGTQDEPAILTFHREKKPFIITKGLFYDIDPERIASDEVAVVIRIDKDSIHHHAVGLRYIRDKRTLSLIKKDEGMGKAPFYDSYHQLDMYCEMITWKQGDPVVRLGNLHGSSQTRASFESFNYFREARYSAMLGIDPVHPLSRMNDIARKTGGAFTVQDYAVATRMSKDAVIQHLIDMANQGYVIYDPENQFAQVTPRLRQHILNSAGKLDYDVLQFNSNAEDGTNATLNLLNHDLALHGVSRIVMSDSQDVKIFPTDRTVTVKKGRDMVFSGAVHAGRLKFYGTEYYFHYDKFVIDLLNVDSVSFMATSFRPNDQGEYSLVKVKNVLEQVTGTLEIDDPGNKSGLKQKDFPAFPRFTSTRESYVFYDKPSIQKGVYDRERFHYRSDPFVLDSLDNFSNAGLTFTGTLVSAGIFPDLREPLRLQPDYALGFVTTTAGDGMPLYGRKAQFSDTIKLNNRGLQGSGALAYRTTNLRSRNLVFCPDSTIGRADTLTNVMAAKPSVPLVTGRELFVRLEPGIDRFHAEKIRVPMRMFDGQADLHGHTDLGPDGMTGGGLVDFRNATLTSNLFHFEAMRVRADTAGFNLTDGDISSIAFRTDNVNALIKLDERVGEFVSNGDETKVEFPVNQYICFMDRFRWYMDQGDIELESDRTAAAGAEDLQLSGSNFISIHPAQDSLSFMAPKARYDLKRHLITANDVVHMLVADALITPDSMRLRIRKNAVMDPLVNAVITANHVDRFHTIRDARVDIKARRNFTASGVIDHVDEEGRRFPVNLPNIYVDSTYQTRARGRITREEDFQLSPAFDFFGDVFLTASIKHLTFRGSTRIQHGCNGLERNWMGFEAEIDPMEVFIPVSDTLHDEMGRRLGAGMLLTEEDPFSVYATFLSRTKYQKDVPVSGGKGLLYYDRGRREYVISNKDKIRQRDLPGDLVSLATENCVIQGDGRINYGVDLGRVGLTAVGGTRFEAEGAVATTTGVLLADFHFLENAMEGMATAITAHPDVRQINIGTTYYEKMMRELLGLERSDKLISELSIRGEIRRMPEELVRTIVLGDVKMKWNGPEQSWLSEGDIGIATIGKKPVYRYVKGKVHLERKRSGDVMTIFIMLDEKTYWFFQYSRNYLYAYSSDPQFNTMISELKEDKRKLSGGKDLPDYQFTITTPRKVEDFRDRFGI